MNRAKEYLKSQGLKNPPLDSGISGGGDAPRIYASDVMETYCEQHYEKQLTEYREKHNIFIWIAPVCLNDKIIGYTYEGEIALKLSNNTFSDLDYRKFPTYESCVRRAIQYCKKHFI